jgi:hypothetical protein
MMNNFKAQIDEDIQLIQEEYGDLDKNIAKPEYAFNYWVLSRLYSTDEEMAKNYITEYNDKSVDCFVHYEDIKELYIIQCKYYAEGTSLDRKYINDFLKAPIDALLNGQYKKSEDLQAIFDRAKNDPEYKIGLHFYINNTYKTPDIYNAFKEYEKPSQCSANIYAEYYNIDNIRSLYYDDRFTGSVNFEPIISTKNKGTSLDVRSTEYSLNWMVDLRYVMVNVAELYQIYRDAENKNYKLFEENIREYLGTKGINNGVIKTLNDDVDRENFFYYNNGITVICDKCDTLDSNSLAQAYKSRGNQYGFKLYNPQIVNGCQTINSINEVLKHYDDSEMFKKFDKTFVLVKIFIIDKKTKENKPELNKNIVRYTNSQNSISDKAFASASDTSRFLNLQKEFERRGFLLVVKQSDKNTFSSAYKNRFDEMMKYANKYCKKIGYFPKGIGDLTIDLEKFLKVLLAFSQGGDVAFTKGNQVLNRASEKYKNFSVKIGELFTIDNMLCLWLMHKRADEQKKNNDKRFPVPFYVLGFMGKAFLSDKRNAKLDALFSDEEKVDKVFKFYSKLSKEYTNRYIKDKNSEYNVMIKAPFDDLVFQNTLQSALDMMDDEGIIRKFINE